MDFKLALSQIIGRFQEKKIDYGLIGGFAMGILGVNRATTDIDFLIKNYDAAKADEILKEFGYELNFHSKNFSLYQSPLKPLGRVDFLHPSSPVIEVMLGRKKNHEVFNHKLKVYVLIPEDIIGLKLQAIKHDPERIRIDEDDILQLLKLQKDVISIELLHDHARKLGMTDYLEKILKRSAKNE